jgi:uncharacterized protein YcbX
MPYVSALYTYPIKSCAGIQHTHIALDARGLAYDRRWMVTDPAGQFITMRGVHRMTLVQPTLTAQELILTAPDLPPLHIPLNSAGDRRQVTVWRDTCEAADEGDAAADWMSQALGTPARLVKMPDDTRRLTSTTHTDQPGEVGFADGYPLLFISEASLQDLNARLSAAGKARVPMSRFRPNVVLADCPPYAEDTWARAEINGIRFDLVKPCARCVMTTVDPQTAQQPEPQEPLATLASYRRGPKGALFGQNVIHRGQGVLSVGDPLTILDHHLT